MKTIYILWLFFVFSMSVVAQNQPEIPPDRAANKQFMRLLIKDGGGDAWVSQKLAESIFMHRVDPVFPHEGMAARMSGTVMVEFEITTEGRVRHATPVSGPRLLQGPVLKAVNQWVFRPYTLNGKAIPVETLFKLSVSNF